MLIWRPSNVLFSFLNSYPLTRPPYQPLFLGSNVPGARA